MVGCGRSMMLWVGFMCVILTALICSSEARPPRTFQAGGRDGWRLLPDDGLNRWAEKRRFRVNDTIVFEYEKGKDSVLVVRKRAYHHCNKTSPIHNMTDGFSTLKFTRNGPFYFISGYDQNCLNGQKLRVVVMSPNHHPSPPPAAQTPPPASTPPAASPWSPSPSPSAETPPPSPSPNVPAQPPPSPSAGDGWITAPAPQKSPSRSSAVISWGLTMAAGFLISLV